MFSATTTIRAQKEWGENTVRVEALTSLPNDQKIDIEKVLTGASDFEDASILGLCHFEVVYHVVSCLVCVYACVLRASIYYFCLSVVNKSLTVSCEAMNVCVL